MPPERRLPDDAHARSRRALSGSGARRLQRDEAACAIVEAQADGVRVAGEGDPPSLPADVPVPAGPLELREAHGR